MNRRRIVALMGLGILAVLTFVVALVSCTNPETNEVSYHGKSCQTDADCPFYLACGEGACRHRCRGGSCPQSGDDCRENLCYPTRHYTDTSSGSYPSPTTTATSCNPDGAPIRKDLPAPLTSSSNAFAMDATYIYVPGTTPQPLGAPKTSIKAARWDGTGPFVDLTPPADNFQPQSLVLSGSSLFFHDYTMQGGFQLSRIAVPATAPVAPTSAPGTLLLRTSAFVFVNRPTGFMRVDATSLAETLLDAQQVTVAAASESHVFWAHNVNGGGGANPPPGSYEVYRAPIASGAAEATGVPFPQIVEKGWVGALGASGSNALFYVAASGALAKLELTANAQPTVFRAAETNGLNALVFEGGFAYWRTVTNGPYCQRLRRMSLTTAEEKDIVAFGANTNGFFILDDAIVWSDYGSIRRVAKPK